MSLNNFESHFRVKTLIFCHYAGSIVTCTYMDVNAYKKVHVTLLNMYTANGFNDFNAWRYITPMT